jgi:tetratricopeptide (TPR) repeat protein
MMIKKQATTSAFWRVFGLLSTITLVACSDEVVVSNNEINVDDTQNLTPSISIQEGEEKSAQQALELIAPDKKAYIFEQKSSADVINKIAQDFNFNGDRFFQENAFEEALVQYQHALKTDPSYAQAWSNLGFTLIQLEAYPDAILANKEAIRHAKGDSINTIKASGHYNLATIYKAQQRWQEALDHYNEALKYRDHPAYREGISAMKIRLK